MRTIPLPAETRELTGFSHIVRLTYADLLTWTSGTAQAIVPENTLASTANTLPAGTYIEKLALRVVTAFTSSGGTITTLTMSLGDSGSATQFLTTPDLKTAAYTVAATTTRKAYTATDYIRATAAISGQTMASLNAGELDLYINLIPIGELYLVKQP